VKGADYCLVVEGNQKSLFEEVVVYFENFQSELGSVVVKEEEGHGRVEWWEYFLETDVDWLPMRVDWLGFRGVYLAFCPGGYETLSHLVM